MSHPARRTHRLHRATPSEKQAQKQEISPHAHALAQAQHLAGETIRILLDDLGASNPTGGVQTILEALVEVDTPGDKLHELVALGKHRLAQQQELITIPNPTGYLIGIMRNLAVEALLKGWNVAQLRAEDEEKHAQALRRTPRAGAQSPTPEEDAAPPEEVPVPMPEPPDEATSESQADQQEAAWEVERRAAEEEARHYAALSPDPRARQVWQSVLDRIQPKVSQSAFAIWFQGTNGLAFEGETLIVRVGSGFGRTHLETRFYDLIERAVHEQWDAQASARFVVVEDSQEGDALLMTPEQEAGDDDC